MSKINQENDSNRDAIVNLARLTLENYIKTGETIDVPSELSEELLKRKAGVFVSLKRYGKLRGCIGTIMPTAESIAKEIIQNAISAGTQDPRFNPVKVEELPEISYSVDVLSDAEQIDSLDDLDVKRYGVIVRAGRRAGLLLPDLEGVDTPEHQVAIALQKAGIRRDENFMMERFEVIRHGEK